MLIYETLKKDHETLKNLLNQLLELTEHDSRRKDLIKQIRDEFIPHARAEEAVFYNPLRSVAPAKEAVRHSYQDHIEAESLLKTLQAKEKIDMNWKKTAHNLKVAVEHHIQEEETTIFSFAKQVFSEQEASQISEAFEKMKPQIKEEGFMGTTLDLIENLMPPRFSKTILGKKSKDIHP